MNANMEKQGAAAAKNTEFVSMGAGSTDVDVKGSQFLTFALADEEYGVDILRVQEIKGWTPVTRVPNTPDYVRGVLNLRGTIVPIVDMRARFNLEEVEYTPVTVIIVLAVASGEERRVIGIVVDAVSDVLNVSADDIKPPPDFGAKVNIEFINGLATIDDHMVMLMDADKLVTSEEMSELEKIE